MSLQAELRDFLRARTPAWQPRRPRLADDLRHFLANRPPPVHAHNCPECYVIGEPCAQPCLILWWADDEDNSAGVPLGNHAVCGICTKRGLQ